MDETKAIIEAVLFSAGREVSLKELQLLLEKSKEEIEEIIQNMNLDYAKSSRGIEIVKADENYQIASKSKYYDYIVKIIDKRN